MSTTAETTQGKIRAKPGKYVTFRLAHEMYAIGVLHVREIIGLAPITQVPNMPEFVKGVINLRGRIIPVVDLRQKFGLGQTEHRRETCIIVVDLQTAEGPLAIGAIVDAVLQVTLIEQAALEPSPSFGVRVDTSFLLGMARTDKEVRLLLDIEKVLSDAETAALEEVQAQTTVAKAAAGKAAMRE